MPKRKRPYISVKSRQSKDEKYVKTQKVNDLFDRARKNLYRVLKTARSFERQKLSKRLKQAESAEAKARINTELKMLKSLDLHNVVNTRLYNILLRIKSFAEIGILPDGITKVEKKGTGESLAEDIALNNVVSGMLNIKTVKDTIEHIIKEVYLVMDITVPMKRIRINNVNGRNNKLEPQRTEMNRNSKDNSKRLNFNDPVDKVCEAGDFTSDLMSPEWEGFGSSQEGEEKFCEEIGPSDNNEDGNSEEKVTGYRAHLCHSSDKENTGEISHYSNLNPRPRARSLSYSSIAPSSLSSSSESLILRDFAQPPNSKSGSAKQLKSSSASGKAGFSSTFLPTLMGGYWSGSEETASDLEDFTPSIKKNRPGQMARRAIAEKKYGKMANHLRLGKTKSAMAVEKRNSGRDNGWDPKRGAITNADVKMSRDRNRGQYKKSFGTNKKLYSGQRIKENKNFGNDVFVERVGLHSTTMETDLTRVRKTKRDDLGVLHPSWQAAKKAKELKQTAKFQGQKIVF